MQRSKLVVLGLAAVLVPAAMVGQDPPASARTHTVRAGETLCSIARAELGDCKRWPELQRANGDRIANKDRIFPGMVLTIPGVASGQAAAPRAERAPAAAPAAQAAPPAPADEPRAIAAGAVAGSRITVFTSAGLAPARESADAEPQRAPHSTVRAGEYIAAPIPAADVQPAGAGRIVAAGEIQGIAASQEVRLLQITDRVFVVAPAGMNAAPGAKMLSFRWGPLLPNGVRVLAPSGVLEIERVTPGAAATARVLTKFEPMFVGDGLLPLDVPPPADLARPQPVTNGAQGTVVWVRASPVLATLQSYAIIDRGERDGLHPGDQVELFRPRAQMPDGVVLPEIHVATARVLRVTAYGATVLVFEQQEPDVNAGVSVRVTAKVP